MKRKNQTAEKSCQIHHRLVKQRSFKNNIDQIKNRFEDILNTNTANNKNIDYFISNLYDQKQSITQRSIHKHT